LTKFLALDKCLPNRDFLQVIEIPEASSGIDGKAKLEYDLEWLAIIRASHAVFSFSRSFVELPSTTREKIKQQIPHEKEWIKTRISELGRTLEIPQNFQRSVEPFNPTCPIFNETGNPCHNNPQLQDFLDFLQLENIFRIPETQPSVTINTTINPDEIILEDI